MKYPVKFNIRPQKSKRFFKILIFKRRIEMYAFFIEYAKLSGWKPLKGTHRRNYGIGRVGTYDPKPAFDSIILPYYYIPLKKGVKPKNDIGVMIFFSTRVGAGLVAHEFGHAAFHHQRIKLGFKTEDLNLGPNNCPLEEECLYDLASMVRKFTIKCYELGVYKK